MGLPSFYFFFYQVFQGNFDNDTVIKRRLSHRIFARYIRFNPLAWNAGGFICLRVEIYECLPTKGTDRFVDAYEWGQRIN